MKLAITHLVLSTATFGLMLAVPQNAQASGLIRNVTTTQSGFGLASPTTVTSVITNGFGLQGPPLNRPSLTGNHALSNVGSTSATNSWRSGAVTVTSGPLSTMVLEFAFNRIYNLAGFSFWNLGGSSTLADQGIKTVTIEYKLGSGSWTTLTGAPTSFAKGTSATTGTISAQVFDFSSPVYATNVRFRNMSNFGGTATGGNNRLGLSEIQFTSIPEPSSTLALLALGLAGMGLGLRKRV